MTIALFLSNSEGHYVAVIDCERIVEDGNNRGYLVITKGFPATAEMSNSSSI